MDQRPLPSVERRAGPEPVRLVGDRALSEACSLPVTTAVTCPTVRIHPAIVAQAAATAAVMTEGKFVLGVGTGEALNEHVLGDPWPSIDVRLEMLEEAVAVMRELWAGGFVTCTASTTRSTTPASTRFLTSRPRCTSRVSDPRPPTWRLESATATSPPRATPSSTRFKEATKARAGRRQGRVRRHGRRGRWARPPPVGQRRAAGRTGAGAALAATLRAGLRARHRGEHARVRGRGQRPRDAPGADQGVRRRRLRRAYIANMGPHHQQMIEFYGREVLPHLS